MSAKTELRRCCLLLPCARTDRAIACLVYGLLFSGPGPAVTKPDGRWVATGPGHGIQLLTAALSMIARVPGAACPPLRPAVWLQGRTSRPWHPCISNAGLNKRRPSVDPARPLTSPKGRPWPCPEAHSHAFYHHDHGRSWKLGGIARVSMHECRAVQRQDGSLLLSMRNYVGLQRRAFATSIDGGLSRTRPRHHPDFYCPVCQAGLVQRRGDEQRSRGLIVYSSPGGPRRRHMTIRFSRDGGETWPITRTLREGPATYSDLAQLPGGEIGCLYERGDCELYERPTFARFIASAAGQ